MMRVTVWGKMMGQHNQSKAVLAGLALALAACAPGMTSLAPQAQASDEVPARASQLAQALADAESAHDSGDTQKLALLVSSLRANGVAPREDAGPDMVAMWSQKVGSDATPFRGRLLGPGYVRGELEPGESWRSAQTFKSGIPSTLAVSHKGAGPVRMKVSDQTQRLVCRPGSAREPACRFTPLYTQRYQIELVNEGTGRAVYYLVFD